ncbi:MAG: hypothetical protein LUC87_06015 [Clostridiales bacterium]|nr:hypothetical protein [Clostridiales bacterium]
MTNTALNKNYRTFKAQVDDIQTEQDLKKAHIAICQSYSAYGISHTQFTSLRDAMISKREQKGFTWGRGI